MTATLSPAVYSRVNGYYGSSAVGRKQKATIERAVTELTPYANNKFDTIVTQGVSGNIVGPLLGYLLGVKWAVIRKDDDINNHDDGGRIVGELGTKLLFLDDFTSSGRTFRMTVNGIKNSVDKRTWNKIDFVGRYFYENDYEPLKFFLSKQETEWGYLETVNVIWNEEASTRRVDLQKNWQQLYEDRNRAERKRILKAQKTFKRPDVPAYSDPELDWLRSLQEAVYRNQRFGGSYNYNQYFR